MATAIKQLDKQTRKTEQNWWIAYAELNSLTDEDRGTVERLYDFKEGCLGESEA